MALTKDQKHDVVSKVNALLESSKMVVVASYPGTSVKALQQLRREAKENGTSIQVLKNRLVIKALSSNETFKDTDVSSLTGQLLYAFNSEDEVAPAQSLASFAKKNPSIAFVGAISADGTFMSADEVKTLATLPSKAQLIGELLATLSAPLNDVANALSGNLHSLLDGIETKATN